MLKNKKVDKSKTFIDILISFNVYSLYFVRHYLLGNSAFSPQSIYSYSLSVFLVVHSSMTLFLSNYIENLNWRLIIFIGSVFNILMSILFEKKILKNVNEYKMTLYPRYSLIFLIWTGLGILSLILLTIL